MNEREEFKKVEQKYVLLTFESQKFMSASERVAYGLAWKQATEYFNEMIEVNNRHALSQMSDAQFNEFMRNQLDSEN